MKVSGFISCPFLIIQPRRFEIFLSGVLNTRKDGRLSLVLLWTFKKPFYYLIKESYSVKGWRYHQFLTYRSVLSPNSKEVLCYLLLSDFFSYCSTNLTI